MEYKPGGSPKVQPRPEAWENYCGTAPGQGVSDPYRCLRPPLLPRVGGEQQGRVLPALEPGSDSEASEVREKDAAAPAGDGKTAPSDEFRLHASNPPEPYCAHQVKGTQPCLPFNHLAGCLGLRARPPLPPPAPRTTSPSPAFGTLASSGGSPAAFILICVLCGNSVWGILITLPLHWALFLSDWDPHPQAALSPLSDHVSTGAQRREWLGSGVHQHLQG